MGNDGAGGSDGTGGGIYNETSSPTVTNCILWGDEPNEISNSSSSPTVTYSDVEGGTGQAWFGTGCIEADPLFIATLHLPGGSPCIDAGDNGAVPVDVTEDIEGNSRIIDGDYDSIATVDMGAYEYCDQQPMEIWVDDDYWDGGDNDGHIWGYDAFALIQHGINAAGYGTTVHVAGGTYHELITLKNGVAVIGAGAGVTIIDGDAGGSVVTSNGCDANTVLEGFTITNGSAANGGGMYSDHSSTTVRSCIFKSNAAGGVGDKRGGGMYNYYGSPKVSNCTFSQNSADFGGGLYNYYSNATVSNCLFSENAADGTSANSGGGMMNVYCSPTVVNCIFVANSAKTYGGGMGNASYSNTKVTNCTFSGNSAGSSGGGIYNVYYSYPKITNCIIWGDTALSYREISNVMNSSPTISYSDIAGCGGSGGGWNSTYGADGGGNLDADPNFVNAAIGDVHIRSQFGWFLDSAVYGQLWILDEVTSSCIDAGHPSSDVGDEPPNNGGRINMGAYGGTSQASKSPDIPGDVNGDGKVDFRDIAIVAGNWLAGTEPEL